MKLFAILLYLAIGSVFGELEHSRFREERLLEVSEDEKEARSLISFDDGKNLYRADEGLRVEYVQDKPFDQVASSSKDFDPVEKSPSRNPSPAIETSTVEPSSSRSSIKKNLEIMYFGKHLTEGLPEARPPRRSSTESKRLKEIKLNFLKMLLRSTGAVSRKEKNLASNSRRFPRRRRQVEEGTKTRDAEAEVEAEAEASLREPNSDSSTSVEDPPSAISSLKVGKKFRMKLPVSLRLKMLNTDETEEKLVESYSSSMHAPVDLISNYNSALMDEREELRKAVAGGGQEAVEVMKVYKTLRKGTPWNSLKMRAKFKKFFEEPSAALTEYENLKLAETAIEGYLLRMRRTSNWNEEEESEIEEDVEEVKPEKPQKPKTKDAAPKPKKAEKDKQFTTGRPKMEVGEVRDDQNSAQSRNEYLRLSEVFKEPLKIQLKNTDAAEKVVLLSYIQSDYAPDNLLDDYYAERKKEIELLKTELAEAGPKKSELLAMYKSIRKGAAWNFQKSGSKQRQNFFKKSSAGRTEYEELKKKELDIDRYLDGSHPIEDKAPEKDDKAEAEGIQRASAIEEDQSKEAQAGTEQAETAVKKGDDPTNVESSLMVQNDLKARLSEWLAGRIAVTNTAEEALLDSYAQSTTASTNLLTDYNDAKAKEREVLKLEMAGGGPEEAAMLTNYKKLRKGAPWNSLKLQDKFKAFFDTPSAALTEYLDLKKDELSIDLFLSGENAVTVGNAAVPGENGDLVTRYAHRKAMAKFFERARAKEDEENDMVERGARDKDTETVEVEYDTYDENDDDDDDTYDDETTEAINRNKSPDDVRQAGAESRETATTTTATTRKNMHIKCMLGYTFKYIWKYTHIYIHICMHARTYTHTHTRINVYVLYMPAYMHNIHIHS